MNFKKHIKIIFLISFALICIQLNVFANKSEIIKTEENAYKLILGNEQLNLSELEINGRNLKLTVVNSTGVSLVVNVSNKEIVIPKNGEHEFSLDFQGNSRNVDLSWQTEATGDYLGSCTLNVKTQNEEGVNEKFLKDKFETYEEYYKTGYYERIENVEELESLKKEIDEFKDTYRTELEKMGYGVSILSISITQIEDTIDRILGNLPEDNSGLTKLSDNRRRNIHIKCWKL